jgi:hypothetical protein
MLLILLAGSLLASVAWFVHGQGAAEAHGIPEKYKETVRKGLEYLVKNQFEDGHWEGDGGKHPVATTALAGMALLMDGNAWKGKYAANIKKAADWLMSQSQAERDGLIFSGHASEMDHYMDGHGLATQFLAWSLRDALTSRPEGDPTRWKKQLDVVRRAAAYIIKSQSSQGGWYRTSKVEGHDFAEISTTAIEFQALKIAAGFVAVDFSLATADAQHYLTTEVEKLKEEAKSDPNPRRTANSAAALACRTMRLHPLGFREEDELCAKLLKRCRSEIPRGRDVKFGRDELAHCWYAQALYQLMLDNHPQGLVSWNDYRTTMFDHLRSSQTKDGSWPAPPEAEGISVGPIYSTAAWCAVLQFDKKRHPLTQDPDIISR